MSFYIYAWSSVQQKPRPIVDVILKILNDDR